MTTFTAEPFVLYPKNCDFVAGKTERPPDPDILKAYIVHLVAGVGSSLFLLLFLLYGLISVSWSDLSFGDEQFLPLLISAAFLLCMLSLVFVKVKRIRFHRYIQNHANIIVEGKFVACKGKHDFDSNGFRITRLHYRFLSPTSGQEIKNDEFVFVTRNDLTQDTLPPPGTPVAILYADDKHYRVL